MTEINKIRRTLLRNIRYHEEREAFFRFYNRLLDLSVVLGGSATIMTLLAEAAPLKTAFTVIIPTFCGGVQLVLGWQKLECLHSELRRKFLRLNAKLTPETSDAIQREIEETYTDEPPTYYALDALCLNAAMRALREDESKFLVVGFWRKTLRNWRRFADVSFPRAKPQTPNIAEK